MSVHREIETVFSSKGLRDNVKSVCLKAPWTWFSRISDSCPPFHLFRRLKVKHHLFVILDDMIISTRNIKKKKCHNLEPPRPYWRLGVGNTREAKIFTTCPGGQPATLQFTNCGVHYGWIIIGYGSCNKQQNSCGCLEYDHYNSENKLKVIILRIKKNIKQNFILEHSTNNNDVNIDKIKSKSDHKLNLRINV